ncbi:hypothetical protein [Cupriavidus alkaliphilus]|uniref:Uncharacterized protein n=1 Tax=Cupriavidus alkaliphilus TaxID=942866 RepID=A0A7W4V6P7_9BURK|nr:hypothetical protein [Cupriavidus alkaliphilus]MBB3006004.1 hypothetical protein [Cupriavidus alkaliphilus]
MEKSVGVEEDRRRFWNSADTSIGEAIKSLFLLNAGSVIAMLGFIQAMLGKPEWPALKPFVLVAGLLFLIGAMAVIPAFSNRAAFAMGVIRGDPDDAIKRYGASSTYLVISLLVFMAGAVLAGVGIALKL